MRNVILIHANCHNSIASGDYSFAGNIAKDIISEIQKQGISHLDVILVSPSTSIHRFEKIYGKSMNGRISIEGISVGLSSLEGLDAIDNTVIAFIDANRCNHSPTHLIKRILSPDSKFLFVANANKIDLPSLSDQKECREIIKSQQLNLYDYFSENDMFIGSAGFGLTRLGLPTMTKTVDMPSLSLAEQESLPKGKYGFMYLKPSNYDIDCTLMAQYMTLSSQEKYILVGYFGNQTTEIEYVYNQDTSLPTSNPFPPIEYYPSLPNRIMRNAVKQASSTLILSTGVTSTLEVMSDNKLPYYQDLSENEAFVTSYLYAVVSIVRNDATLVGAMPQLIIELSNLLFANKPLNKGQMKRTQELLALAPVNENLRKTNQTIIDKASGKLAPRLLQFLREPQKTTLKQQLTDVCLSLRKSGERKDPPLDQALRRAAAWNRLLELKILLKSIPKSDLDKTDTKYKRTALHWAALERNYDCARALVNAGISLDIQDYTGQTALHKAVKNGDQPMEKLLVNAGASVPSGLSPENDAATARCVIC